MKRVLLCFCVALFLCPAIYAQDVMTVVEGGEGASQVSSKIGGLSLGYI